MDSTSRQTLILSFTHSLASINQGQRLGTRRARASTLSMRRALLRQALVQSRRPRPRDPSVSQ